MAVGVLIYLVTLDGRIKALFLAVWAPLGYTPAGCFSSLRYFSSHSLGEAGHLRINFGVGGHQLLVVGCEGCNSSSKLIQHGLAIGGGCGKVVKIFFEVVLAVKFANGAPILGRWGGGGWLAATPHGNLHFSRGQTATSFLHVGGLAGRLPHVPGLRGLFGVPLSIIGAWEGARLQHCVRCNDQKGRVRDSIFPRSLRQFLLVGLESVHVLDNSIAINMVFLHFILQS